MHSFRIWFGRSILKVVSGKSMYIEVFVQSFRTSFVKKNTHLRYSISKECRVTLILHCLETGSILIMIVDLFGLGESTTLKIMRECCEAIRILLKPLILKIPSLAWMKKIIAKFEALHGI